MYQLMVDNNKKIRRLECLRSVRFREPGHVNKENPSKRIDERRKNKILNTRFKKKEMHD